MMEATKQKKFLRGDIEDCGDFAVWWYMVPPAAHPHSAAYHRCDGPLTKQWAYALRSEDGISWSISQPVSGFASRDAAVFDAVKDHWSVDEHGNECLATNRGVFCGRSRIEALRTAGYQLDENDEPG